MYWHVLRDGSLVVFCCFLILVYRKSLNCIRNPCFKITVENSFIRAIE